MQKYYVRDGNVHHSDAGMENDCGTFYDAADVDVRIAELRTALLDGIEWADKDMPREKFERMMKAAS